MMRDIGDAVEVAATRNLAGLRAAIDRQMIDVDIERAVDRHHAEQRPVGHRVIGIGRQPRGRRLNDHAAFALADNMQAVLARADMDLLGVGSATDQHDIAGSGLVDLTLDRGFDPADVRVVAGGRRDSEVRARAARPKR